MPQLKIPSARHPQMPEDQSVRVTITDAWGHIQYESVVTPSEMRNEEPIDTAEVISIYIETEYAHPIDGNVTEIT